MAILLVSPLAADAQLDLSGTTSTVTGTVSGTTSTVTGTTGTLLGITTVLGDTGTLAAGTVDALDSSAGSVGVPSLLTAEVPDATVIGYVDEIDSGASLAALNLNISGIAIGADSIVAEVLAPLGGTAIGSSDVSNLSVNGVPIPVTGDPNQSVDLPGGVLLINEQQVLSDGTTVVNALHAIVYGVADIVVGSATGGASGGDAKAVQASY